MLVAVAARAVDESIRDILAVVANAAIFWSPKKEGCEQQRSLTMDGEQLTMRTTTMSRRPCAVYLCIKMQEDNGGR